MSFSCYDVTFLLFEFNVCKSVCERKTSQILAGFIFYFILFGPYAKHCKIRIFMGCKILSVDTASVSI